jgi:hypothetical protein
MKLKYIIPSFIAALAMFASCSEKFEPSYLGDLKVSSSYVALSTSGSSAEIEVRSNAEWAFEASSVPEWLTVSPMSGTGGNSYTIQVCNSTSVDIPCPPPLQTNYIVLYSYYDRYTTTDVVTTGDASTVNTWHAGKEEGN